MAFTQFVRKFKKKSPLDCDIKVMQAHVVNSAAETNLIVPIPWENVRLVKWVGVVAEAIDATGGSEIDLELNAAAGTEMMTMTVAKSAAVGTVYEGTVSNQPALERLSASDSTRDAMNIEVDGSAAAAGSLNMIFYFEPEHDKVS